MEMSKVGRVFSFDELEDADLIDKATNEVPNQPGCKVSVAFFSFSTSARANSIG